MAGDWIKIERATPDKAKVWQIALSLGITSDEALGKLVRFWCWVDQNLSESCPELKGSSKDFVAIIDSVAHCVGFAEALAAVGWLEFEDGRLRVPGYDEHLSRSAKQRAADAKKKARQRAKASPKERDNCPSRNGTHVPKSSPQEKRRTEKNLPPDTPQYGSRPAPVDVEQGGISANGANRPEPAAGSPPTADSEAAGSSQPLADSKARLASLSILAGPAAVDDAAAAGRSPELIADLIEHWSRNRETLGEGAVVLRLRMPLQPNEHAASHWPSPSNGGSMKSTAQQQAAERQRAVEQTMRLRQEREDAMSRTEVERVEKERRETDFGAALDAMPKEGVRAMIEAEYGDHAAFALKHLATKGLTGWLRDELLQIMAAASGQPPSLSE